MVALYPVSYTHLDQRTLRVLEYHKIISLLEEFALSDLGKDLIKRINPSSDIAKVQTMLDRCV